MDAQNGVTWSDVDACKDEFDRGRMPMLREQWQALCKVEVPEYKQVEVDSEDDPWQDHPIRALFRYISYGRYPPPELLMAMRGAFDEYLEAGGDLALEEAFFGKPPRRAGNYAQRNKEIERNFKATLRYAEERKKPTKLKGGKGPAERAAAGMPITGKALTRIVQSNRRLAKLIPAKRQKSRAK